MWNGRAAGFTYLGLLIFMAIAGVGMAGIGTLTSVQLQRERETELLFVGEQFRRAIESYYRLTPGPVKMFPKNLQELVEDKRFPKPIRHLRRIYLDPVTGSQDWGIVSFGGRIMGVYSLSLQAPRKKAGFAEPQAEFAKAQTYRDWRFTYLNPADISPHAATSPLR